MNFDSVDAGKLVEEATKTTGKTLESIANNPIVTTLHNTFGINWFMTLLGGVNIEKALANVKDLQQKYQKETKREIANRLIANKAIEGAKVGVITNIIPPVAAWLLGLELAAITKLQAEMVYEIAALYGLDLHDPTRRGEVAGIFALAIGGDIVKGGLNLVELVPGIGAVIGASSNAFILYALGQTACGFYEEKSRLIKS